ncbi:MAG: DUF2029 domain-containing protein [Armatimonadota bacterium]|nr:DUF2029 domain-containing protein [Armatimonadota bacterium]
MGDMFRGASLVARIALLIAVCFLAVQCISLGKRAWRGDTDFSVFYRAAVDLSRGVGGEIYAQRDQPTGWYNCIPPVGMGVFVAMSWMHRLAAGIVWGLFNVGLLALCFDLLRRIYSKMSTERLHYEATLPWATVSLAVFGGVCIQTGQTSVLFVTCWLAYVLVTSENRRSFAGFALALPAALKLYPILFAIIPLIRRRKGELVWISVWLVVLSIVVPAIMFRHQFLELLTTFFQYQVFDPDGRVMTAANPTAISNQGLDAVMLRYFSYVPSLHDRVGNFPSLGLDPHIVMFAANVIRVAIVSATAFASVRWIRRSGDEPPLLLLSLWCATLYVILPGAKARYAIYVLPAFLLMIAGAHRAWSQGRIIESRKVVALVVVCAILLLQILPTFALEMGLGLIGPFVLWCYAMNWLAADSLARRPGQDYASGRKRSPDVL